MKKLITGLSIFLGVSISGIAQSANHDQYKETISYLQGNSIYDRGVMTFFEEMRDYGFARSDLGLYFYADFFQSEMLRNDGWGQEA